MGRVAAPYGVRGWCRIQPFSETIDALLDHPIWWLRRTEAGEWREQVVEEARVHGNSVLAKFAGVETPEAAREFRGTQIGVPQMQLRRQPDELFWSELVGFVVVNRAGSVLGKVVELIDNGAHPILRVRAEDGQTNAERLIPWVGPYIDGMDVAARRIDVDWASDY